eukprot:TRINITY_DN24821_c0_g1_i1.p1 TRINITY_DN24821_c0_g1~~TRINITY_DN24821_c0_g1_i1.p1  ORF type:complete len:339 (+),score=89.60 TRINITY_DN24821_c0_g1_i1:59-1018(+)
MEAEADTPMREEEEDVSLSDLLARSKQHQTQQKRTLLERLGVPTLSATLDALQAAGLSEEPLASLANATAVVQKLTRVPLLALACSAPHLRVFMLRVLGYEDPDPAQAALVAQEVSCESCGAVCCAADCFCCKCGKPVASGRLAREELNSFRTEQPDSVSAQLTDIQFQALRLRHLVVFFGVVRASNVPVRYQFRVLTEIHTAVLSIVCTGLLQGPAGLQGTPGTRCTCRSAGASRPRPARKQRLCASASTAPASSLAWTTSARRSCRAGTGSSRTRQGRRSCKAWGSWSPLPPTSGAGACWWTTSQASRAWCGRRAGS